jgi:hypothetical protein
MFFILKMEAGGAAEMPEDTVYPTELQNPSKPQLQHSRCHSTVNTS